ncbi:MAG: hypothetical protein ACRENB_16905, partial [Gemmatimonadales bacterium]
MADQEARAALDAAKRSLIARLLAEEGLDRTESDAIPPRPPGEDAPQSYAQEVLWLLDRAAPGMVAYNTALAWRLRGPLAL